VRHANSGGVIGIGGSLLAAHSASSAANKAAAAQTASDQAAIAEQQRQYNTTRSDLMPFQTAGVAALGQQGNLLEQIQDERSGIAEGYPKVRTCDS
jgi:hypothetical protein